MKEKGTADNIRMRIDLGQVYEHQYGRDLENKRDALEGYNSVTRIFCMDCSKYFKRGKYIVDRNGCRGSEMEWAVCPYRKIALEVMKYG